MKKIFIVMLIGVPLSAQIVLGPRTPKGNWDFSGATVTGLGSTPLCAALSASGTAETCTAVPPITSYTGLLATFIPTVAASGGGYTLNISSIGSVAVKLVDGTTNPSPMDIKPGRAYLLTYDGTALRLPSTCPKSAGVCLTDPPYNASGYRVMSHATATTATTVTLASTAGFFVGHQMICVGVSATSQLTITAINTGTGVVTFTPSSSAPTTSDCWEEGDTNGAITSGQPTLTLVSAATYAAGQGVTVVGAGASSADLFAKVLSIAGNVVTLDTNAGTTQSTALVKHNELYAFQRAFADYFFAGATFYLPSQELGLYGNYNIDGPTIDAGSTATHCNCVLQVPTLKDPASITGAPIFAFVGSTRFSANIVPSGVVIKTYRTGTVSLFGAYSSTSTNGKFTEAQLEFDNVWFRGYSNFDAIFVDATNIAGLIIKDNTCDEGPLSNGVNSTHTGAGCYTMPPSANNVTSIMSGMNQIYRMNVGMTAGEHFTQTGILLIDFCAIGVVVSSTAGDNVTSAHPMHFDHLVLEQNTVGLKFSTNHTVVNVSEFSGESNTTDIACISGNNARGLIQYSMLGAADPVIDSKTFCFNLMLYNLEAGYIWGRGYQVVSNTSSPVVNPGYSVTASGSAHFAKFGYGETGSAAPFTDRMFFNGGGVGMVWAVDSVDQMFLSTAGVLRITIVKTVATLPTCDATATGSLSQVSDALAPTYLATLVGGGAVVTPAYCNGTNWVAH